MKLKALIVAIVVLVALVAYVFVVEIKGGKEREAAKEWESKLIKVNDWDEVRQIEIWNYKQHMVFERVGTDEDGEGIWRMKKPVDWPVDKYNFNSLQSTLQFIEIDRRIDAKGKDLGQYGLAMPPTIVVVKTESKTLEVLVGELSPVGDSVYVKYPDSDEVFMVSAVLNRQLKHPPFYFRDKRVFRVDKEDIRSFELEVDGKLAYRLEKGDDGVWYLKKPRELRADDEVVDDLLSKLESLRIRNIPMESISSLAAYGFDAPVRVLRITDSGGNTKTLLVSSRRGKNKGRVFAKREAWPQLLELDDRVLKDFVKTPDELRDRHIAHLDMSEVKEIVLKYPDRELKVWRADDGHWHAEPVPEGKKVSEFWASNLGWHALKMKVKEFVSDSPTESQLKSWGLVNPAVEVEIVAKDGKIYGFSLGNEAGENRRYGRLTSGAAVIFEDPEMNDFLKPDEMLWGDVKTEGADGKNND